MMDEEQFKKLRYKFWKLGKEKRKKIILDMGFGDLSWRDQFLEKGLGKDGKEIYTQNVDMELVQRKILYFIVESGREKELAALIELQEEILAAEEDKGERLRVTGPVLGEIPPSREELAEIKYVPGQKKPWEKGA
jgi:hypothetical protein